MPLYGNDLSTGAFLTSNKQSVQTITGKTGTAVTLERTVVLAHENINVFKNGLLLTPEVDYTYVDAFKIITSNINFTNGITLTKALVSSDTLVVLYNTFGGDVPDFVTEPFNAVVSCLKEVRTALENNDNAAAVSAINATVGTN